MAGDHTNLRNIVDEGKGKLQWERDLPASALSNLESLASTAFLKRTWARSCTTLC